MLKIGGSVNPDNGTLYFSVRNDITGEVICYVYGDNYSVVKKAAILYNTDIHGIFEKKVNWTYRKDANFKRLLKKYHGVECID